MSTKIYNAYRYNGTIEELIGHFRNLRMKWQEGVVTFLLSQVKDGDKKGLKAVLQRFAEDMKKEFSQHGDLNFSAGAVVYCFEDNLYVQFCINDSRLLGFSEEWYIDEKFDDWHYQNQSDPWYVYDSYCQTDDTILAKAAEEWKERKYVWEGIFKDTDKASDESLCYHFLGRRHVWKIENSCWENFRKI